jgi:3-methyladenine DNA glycosylase/8-oxoguanine DNA glycosylase
MVSQKKLALAERKRRHALERAQKAVQNVLDLSTQVALVKDAAYKQAETENKRIRGQLHLTRLNIAKKSMSVKMRREALEKVERALAQHQEDEKDLERQLDEITQKLENIRKKAETKVAKNLDIDPVEENAMAAQSA